MDPADDVTDPTGPPERRSKAVFVVAAAVACLVPWATQFGGPASWSSTWLPIILGLLIGASGVALIVAGGRTRRIGSALLGGGALGGLLFFISIAVVAVFTYGSCGTCG